MLLSFFVKKGILLMYSFEYIIYLEEEQVSYLRQMGCAMVQGYICSKPLPLAEFEEWVSKRKIQSL